MNKIPILFLLGLFLINGIFAVEVNMNSEYQQGETLIAKISGNFLTSVGRSNILFYKEHVRVSFEYELTKIGNEYYLYALLVGKTEGNYSLSIEDVKYMEEGKVKENNIVKNFSISNEKVDFSVDPGFIDTSENFSITIQNQQNFPVQVSISTAEFTDNVYVFSHGTKEFTTDLDSGEINKINFVVVNAETAFKNIIFSSGNITYKVPVYILGNKSEPAELSDSTNDEIFDFQSSDIILSIPTNSNHKEIVYLHNFNDTDLKDISFSMSDDLSYVTVLSDESLDIDANENASLELSFFSEEEKEVEGYIYASDTKESVSLFVSIKFLQNATSVEIPTTKTCAELNGTIYNSQTNKCDVTPHNAKDGLCCVGIVSPIEENSSGRIVAVILIILLIGFIVWFYFKKYKKSKKPVDLLKVAKGKN
jgi:hypothetical protein